MTRLDDILELYEFNDWAMQRLLQATESLSDEEFTRDMGNSFASIRDTLVHIVGAEWVWLTRWRGTSPSAIPNMDAELTHAQIAAWWREIRADRALYLTGLQEDALDGALAYTNFAGKPFSIPLRHAFRHMVNHSTYHRGQIMTMIKQLGRKPVSSDLILMVQEKVAAG